MPDPVSTPQSPSSQDGAAPNGIDSDLPQGAIALNPTLSRIGRAFLGSGIATTLALLLYRMLAGIALTFANKPVHSDNVTVVNLSAAVRTLVLGVVAMGTGVFGIAALGLLLLGLQMSWHRLTGKSQATPEEKA